MNRNHIFLLIAVAGVVIAYSNHRKSEERDLRDKVTALNNNPAFAPAIPKLSLRELHTMYGVMKNGDTASKSELMKAAAILKRNGVNPS